MKSNFKKALLCFFAVVFILSSILPVFAVNGQGLDEANGIVNGIISYQQSLSGASSVQGWINGALTQNAGTSSEWYVMALSQYGNYNFSSYKNSLLNYLSKNEIGSASSRQKYALALISCGSTDVYIHSVLNDSIGNQGVMSWIFGLHLLNNGYSCDGYSLSAVKQKLISLQLGDGGWAVTGKNSDVDVTAMAVQALAPHYKTDTTVKNAVDKALSLLSVRQNTNGDFASYGVNNPESTAQVLVALSALGIDAVTDTRFIKNGNTLFSGIALYRLSDGSFCHKQGGTSNGTATVQVFYSMVSYIRMKSGRSPLFVFDNRNPSGLKIPSNTGFASCGSENSPDNKTEAGSSIPKDNGTQSSELNGGDTSVNSAIENDGTNKKENSGNTAIRENKSSQKQNSKISYKVWVSIAIIIISFCVILVLYCLKKRNIRNYAFIAIITSAAIVFTLLTNFQSAESYYSKSNIKKQNPQGTVSITIRCDNIPDKNAKHIPNDGVVLKTSEFEIEKGDTVYNVLLSATKKNKIHLETSGSGESIYVQGINNIYEFDFGDLSGWMYLVNGKSPSVSCGEYVLSDSDKIEFIYTCDMGKDF